MNEKMEAEQLSAPSSPSIPLGISSSMSQKLSWDWSKEKSDSRWTSIPPKNFEDSWILFDEFNVNLNTPMKTLIVDPSGNTRIFFKETPIPFETLEKIYREAKVKNQISTFEEVESLLKALKDSKFCPGCDYESFNLPPKDSLEKNPKRLFDSNGTTVAQIEWNPYFVRHIDCEILYFGDDKKRCINCEKYSNDIKNLLSESITHTTNPFETSPSNTDSSITSFSFPSLLNQTLGKSNLKNSPESLTTNALISLQQALEKHDKLQLDYNVLKKYSEKLWLKLNEKEKEVEDLKKIMESVLRQKYDKFSEDEEEVSDGASPHSNLLKRKASELDSDYVPTKRGNKDDEEKVEEISEEKEALGTFSNIVSPRQKNSDMSWMNNYQKLVKFKEMHGHCNVPHGKKYEKEVQKLGYWVKDQRKWKREGKLANHRIQLLDDIGFQWSRLSSQAVEG